MLFRLSVFSVLMLAAAGGISHAATLQHRYDFSTDVSDSVGTADGTLESGATVSGGALQLNGFGAYAALPNGLLVSNQDITIECWVTDNGSGNWSRIFDFGSGTTVYLYLTPQSNSGIMTGSITLTSYGAGEQGLSWVGNRMPIGSPVHVVWTYDSDSTTAKLYVDGALVAQNTGVTITPADLGYTTQNWLGRSQYSGDSYFDGSIDEFRIYDGALTFPEVTSNYNAGPDGLGPVTITDHPDSQAVEEALPATFDVAYSGTAPVYVQWYRDASPISGATNDSYSIAEAALSDDGAVFHAVVSNTIDSIPYTDTSSNAVLSVAADTTAPTLVNAISVFPDGVRVVFSEGVSDASALNIGNYSISYAGGSLSITGAAFGEDKSVVLLSTDAQGFETSYTLHVSNVQDRSSAGNTIAPNSQSDFGATNYVIEDVGAPATAGSADWMSDGVDLTAAGSGVGGTSDQFSFSHKTYPGDFDIQVRVDGMEFFSQWAQAGLMARDGLDTDARFATVFATPGPAGCQFMARSSVGASASTSGFLPSSFPSMWLRLRRTGDLFEGFAGIDGETWERLGSSTINMGSSVEVGYFVASDDPSETITAGFRDESTGSGSIVSSLALPFEPLGPSSRRGAMVISEIMVDTPSEWGGSNSLEFVEIYNTGLITEELTGHRFSGEIDYTFPDGTMLAPGEFLVIAKDPAAAQAFYGVDCLGPYDGKLNNGGGTLRLRNELDGILLEVEYDNKAPWPVAAFGTGHSLVLSHPSYGENDPRAWSASDVIGGSPGTTDSYGTESARGVVINEYLAHTDLPQVDYIELFNTGSSPVDLSGAWLSDQAGTNKFQIANGTTISARGFLSFDQIQLGFALSADGEEIFLVNSNQTRVLDAVSFRGQANGVSEGRYPDGAPNFQELASVTEESANDEPLLRPVVINEIMYHPISESNNDEFIELYNRTGSAVDISNWRLQGGISYEFPDNTEIPANEYVVVAENATNLIARYAQLNSGNTYGNYGGTLGNGGDTVRLSMPEDLVSTNGSGLVVTNIFYIPIDEVTYLDGGRWGEWSDGGGSSLELIDPDADNRQPANWADSDETAKAPWTTIDVTEVLENGQAASEVDEGGAYGEAGDCNRLELFLQGAGEMLVDDVEFLNNGGSSLVQNGAFWGGSSYWDFGGVVRNSYLDTDAGVGGSAALHLVSVARGDTGCNKVYNSLSSIPSIGGSNTGTIRAKVRWLRGSKQILLRLRGNWMEVSREVEVPTQCGTPGMINSQRVSNAGPAIHEVAHSPVLPASGETVVVTARAVDPDGVAAMTLHYREDPSTSYSTATMYDNGTGGDAVAGDGIYSATIPGQSSGTLVAFYVSASDGSATSTFPAAVPVRECLVHWDEVGFTGGLGTYRLWVTDANLSFWASREKNANDTLDATFVYGKNRVVYNVDTMYSGSPFHVGAYDGPLGVACDYEINFHPGERFLGSEPFVLAAEGTGNSFWDDETMQVDLTGTWIARQLGQQYNYRRFVHMVVNGQERGGIYLDTQQPNSEMLDEYFPDDSQTELRKIESWFEFADNFVSQGSVYARLEQVDKSTGGLDTKWYRWTWRPRATSDHNNWFNFTNLVLAVNDTSAINREARVRTWMDVRNFLRPIVTHHVCGSWDSYSYDRGKNMYAFKPDDGGWRLLMWDIELALGNGSYGTTDSIYWMRDSALLNMITAIPSIEREYLAAFQEAVDGPMAPGVAASILNERYANLVANGISVSPPQSIINFISSRRSYIQSVLPSASFNIDGPLSITVSSNNVALTGSAPLQLAEIQVNGIPYPLEWTSTTTWRMIVPLEPGLHGLQFIGYDRFGNPVPEAERAMIVTYTGAVSEPEGVVVINEINPSPEDRDLQFLELHNTSTNELFDLTGWRVNGIGYSFPTGAVIQAGEYLVLVEDPYRFADRNPEVTVFDVYDGSLDPDGETLTLFRPGALPDEEVVVDRVRYESAAPWASSAGGKSLQLIDASQDNARVANWLSTEDVAGGTTGRVVAITHTWQYEDTGTDLGTSWVEPGYDDSGWPAGPALLYDESSPLDAPKSTELDRVDGKTTYYFRSAFTYDSAVTEGASLSLRTFVDDGVVLYLNGEEVFRLGMATGVVDYSTLSTRAVGNAVYEGPFPIPVSALVSGENVLAAEVHQQADDSSDVVFGMTLDVEYPSASSKTPGGANAVTAALPAFPEVWLNELQADNGSGLQDNAGDHDPWVELYNSGTSPVILDGYYLTTDYDTLTQWAFPSATSVPAGGSLVVWCDGEPGESEAGVPHTDFVLPSGIGQVGLVRMIGGTPQVVDYLNYTNLPSNWSYGDVPDGQPFYRFNLFYATPGATNNGAAPPITVSINEWMADNDGTLSDPADGDYEDWIELYNPGSNTVDLGGYFLTDDLLDPYKYEVPNNGHYTIVPGGYLLVWADGEDGQNTTNHPDLHAEFSLSKGGESIGVFASDGTVIDSVTFGAQTTDASEGRYPDGAAGILTMASPTPRAANLVLNTPPVLDPIDDITITMGQTLQFTAEATDNDMPQQTLIYSLTNAPGGAGIGSSSGSFSWTPGSAPLTNLMGVVVSDNGVPSLSDTEWFAVTVVPQPVVGDWAVDGSGIRFNWPSVSGQPYRVYYKDALDDSFWNPLSSIIMGTGGLLNYTNDTSASPQRFYSIGVE